MSDYQTPRTRRLGRMTTRLQVAETRLGRLTAWAVLISLLFNLLVPVAVAAAPDAPSSGPTPPPVGSPVTPTAAAIDRKSVV